MSDEQRPPSILRYVPLISVTLTLLIGLGVPGFVAVNSLSHKLTTLEAEQKAVQQSVAELKIDRATDRNTMTEVRVAFARLETRIERLLDAIRDNNNRRDRSEVQP